MRGNAISSSFPLYMEPRRLLSPEQTQPLMAPRTFLSLPLGTGKERESRKYDECHVHESTAALGSLAAKAWKLGYSNSSKCPIFWVIRLMLDEDTAHAFSLKMERRKGDRTQAGEEAAGADLPVCVSLSLL